MSLAPEVHLSADEPLPPAGALRRCVRLSPERFLSDYWEKQPLFSAAADLPASFNDLFAIDDLDRLFRTGSLRSTFVRVIRDGQDVDPGHWRRSGDSGVKVAVTDYVDPVAVGAYWDAGSTIMVYTIDGLCLPVGDFCRRLADDVGHRVTANAYASPPGRRALPLHYDNHDVFILQIDGSKRWRVYDAVAPLPFENEQGGDLGDPGDRTPLIDVTMRPGDTLYIPRGFSHCVQTEDQRSIHLTLGVVGLTWHDVLSKVLAKVLANERAFRPVLPLGFGGGAARVRAELPELVEQAVAAVARDGLAEAFDAVEAWESKAKQMEVASVLQRTDQAASLALGSRVRLRSGIRPTLSDHRADGATVLVLHRRRIPVPEHLLGVVRLLLDGRAASAQSLAALVPDTSADETFTLVRALVGHGVLVPDDDRPVRSGTGS
ncbi:cupin domain-containing protein [Wenjunlia tyrosinilytica]|uniref:JmjC domain-containing protein n=1 Tax=Wenjunlia tyrosinilytica TaxID=1544741 RepID=A0A917ZZ23_9ACTN|nr:cupin domain-containing protein [Wenjunlia tyrosinilytica]GGP00029.1 hypothetical protein GCM10012280_67840 [Wenjunlia tyrosinilytica]